MQYNNPIIRGYNPDPSIVRVDEDFYLVTSTFEFFPGVPIYHSRNLVNWELINHCLTNEQQLPLMGARNSGGIFAPTIRYHDGVFYMITTNVSTGGNFLVHTRDIRGEWSKPVYINHQGIDPSLLFDDGKVYFCATQLVDGESSIALYEINPMTGELSNGPTIISKGIGGKFPEAPHLYRIGEYYYLMLAEGGTEYGHMETIFRAKDPYGPYEGCPHNPILSHKDYQGSPIQATGHADIVEDQHGNWWMVFLAIRPFKHAMLHNLGRETFLSPLTWDDNGWPVVGRNGRAELCMKGPLPKPTEPVSIAFEDDFSSAELNRAWTFVRNPRPEAYTLIDRGLKLTAAGEKLDSPNPTALLLRQQEFSMFAEASFEINSLPEGGKIGVTAYYNTDYHYAAYITQKEGNIQVALGKSVHDIRLEEGLQNLPEIQHIFFRIQANQKNYTFYYRLDDEWLYLGEGASAALCTEGTRTMTFTGTFLGVFVSEQAEAVIHSFSCDALNG